MSTGYQDHRGTEINVGDKVAFNYQGQVGVGWIKEIKNGNRYNRAVPTFYIEREFPFSEPGKESKVTSPLNLLVIHEDK